MKLIRLNGIANDALRTFMLTPEYATNPLFEFGTPTDLTVDLLTGKVTPSRNGDDVEEYYKLMSAWFNEVLIKEKIPVSVIEKAVIEVRDGKQSCKIFAGGKTFGSPSTRVKLGSK